MNGLLRFLLPSCCLLVLAPVTRADALPATIEFNRDIRPLLSDHCSACHGPDKSKRKADLRLDVPESARGVLVPGKPAPRLVSKAMVERMKPGSVIVDLAVEQGGNCELSEAGKTVVKHGVKILGEANLPASMPYDASMLFARNVLSLLMLFAKGGQLKLDVNDEVIKGTLLTHDGVVMHAPTAELIAKS